MDHWKASPFFLENHKFWIIFPLISPTYHNCPITLTWTLGNQLKQHRLPIQTVWSLLTVSMTNKLWQSVDNNRKIHYLGACGQHSLKNATWECLLLFPGNICNLLLTTSFIWKKISQGLLSLTVSILANSFLEFAREKMNVLNDNRLKVWG